VAVTQAHAEALKAVLELLDSFPSNIRRWVLLQTRSLKAPSTATSTRLQRDFNSDFNDDFKATSKATSNATSNGLQSENERETLVLAFSSFWSLYPRKQSKQEALRNYLKLKPNTDMQNRILQALHEQIASDQWTRDEGRFIPLPSTWLHQQRFNDEVATSNATSTAMFGRTSSNVFEGFMKGHRVHDQ
jgi:hypothetical protein